MKRTFILTCLLACSLAATAESLKGIVRNNTTNKPSAGDEVMLKKIGNGMEDVASTKTNAKGEFSFNVPPAQQPYIVWIQHQGVTYTQRAVPGGQPVVARVFDSSPNVKGITLAEHALLYHSGDAPNSLTGEEIFTVINASTPPTTLLKDRTLEFYLPEGVTINESNVRSGAGTDLKTPVLPTGEKNKYAFKFPVRPGETQFHVVYTLPYSGSIKLDPKSDTPVDTLVIATPDPIKFAASDKALYQTTTNPRFPGVSFYVAKAVQPQRQVSFEISGTGSMPREATQPGGQAPGNAGNADNRPGGGLGVPNEMPNPLRSGQYVFLGILCLFLAAGAVFVFTSNRKAAVAGGATAKPQNRGGMLMEAMKEEVFQLESDRLQGKISQEDYQAAKAALDKTLQRAVQRQTAKAR